MFYFSYTHVGAIVHAETFFETLLKQTSCRRAAATICPAPFLPEDTDAPSAAEQTAT